MPQLRHKLVSRGKRVDQLVFPKSFSTSKNEIVAAVFIMDVNNRPSHCGKRIHTIQYSNEIQFVQYENK
jgi:hypothetical protein